MTTGRHKLGGVAACIIFLQTKGCMIDHAYYGYTHVHAEGIDIDKAKEAQECQAQATGCPPWH